MQCAAQDGAEARKASRKASGCNVRVGRRSESVGYVIVCQLPSEPLPGLGFRVYGQAEPHTAASLAGCTIPLQDVVHTTLRRVCPLHLQACRQSRCRRRRPRPSMQPRPPQPRRRQGRQRRRRHRRRRPETQRLRRASQRSANGWRSGAPATAPSTGAPLAPYQIRETLILPEAFPGGWLVTTR